MNTQDFSGKALLINYLSILFAFLIGLARIRLLDTGQRFLFALLLLAIVTEVVGRILWMLNTNNLFLYHFYSVSEFLLLGALYTRSLSGLIRPIYMKGIVAFFVLFAVINTLFFQSLKEFNSNVTLVESLLLTMMALLYYYKLLRDLEHERLERVAMFWVNVSVFTYFSGAFLPFYVANAFDHFPRKENAVIGGTHAVFNIVRYMLYGVALWVKPNG